MLFSGGLDSAVLLAMERESFAPVWPIHVRAGLAWEAAEAAAIDRLLAAPPFAGRIEPLITLSVDMRDVYRPTHWAIEGRPPAYDTPDEDVYLEGRNIVLVAKASVKCASLGVERLALGPLAGNPFPDATPEFFAAMSRAMSLGLGTAAHDRHAALGDAQGRGRETGPDARRAARAHALVHESVAGRTSVRPVQQVSRARRRVQAGRWLKNSHLPELRTSNFELQTSESDPTSGSVALSSRDPVSGRHPLRSSGFQCKVRTSNFEVGLTLGNVALSTGFRERPHAHRPVGFSVRSSKFEVRSSS